ncbi:pyrimidine-nucleoside phosphorylase [Vagococcus entomophilus]|uniref:Pyrimidine-nucleoside phosphorylase n=1 Tax=Vagococcus entomophilus TaxID=1160095 RepID=A0A430AHG3_9ENTE|nr:pyrimidine-nucleoside phosphorylase [Vagococcus entomophilus]RSU07372.1 pyrimidine-nucleoside phosphorylase [Vagococcus entomophilus]
MRMVDVISKKRDGQVLSKEEIQFFVTGYTNEQIPDYQASALAMAIFFQGMTAQETADLTLAMVDSGEKIDLSEIAGIKVDKHSTGGVGDTTTLVLAPLVAALGIPVAKMSGRGLGHTGGTIDKLESIAGFHVEVSKEEFITLVNQNQLSVVAQSGNLTPADKKMYALRDVTGTVNSIPMIASSIMSKKIAAGADAIVLDVKVGAGAFMKTKEEAKQLAETMVTIGSKVGRKTVAVLSDMSQPLGNAIGNALEVKEAIDTLKGQGPKDLTELVLTLGSQMVVLSNKADTVEKARVMLQQAIQSGAAIEKFKTFLDNQGGDSSVVDDPTKLPQAAFKIEIPALQNGFVSEIVAHDLGTVAMMLGAGRATKNDVIDLGVGLVLNKKVGDPVAKGESLITVYSNEEKVDAIIHKLYSCFTISEQQNHPTLIHELLLK